MTDECINKEAYVPGFKQRHIQILAHTDSHGCKIKKMLLLLLLLLLAKQLQLINKTTTIQKTTDKCTVASDW